jgi:hypothetical protein
MLARLDLDPGRIDSITLTIQKTPMIAAIDA